MNTRHIAIPASLALAVALFAPSAAWGAGAPDLDQTLDELPVVHGPRVLDAGHVDMGPKFVEGQWRFLIHDDVARADADAQSVWRYPDETVFHLFDEAKLMVPDDPAYAFLGAEPGTEVWVVPQTQDPNVVWLGWNTQDPEVMATIDRGVTLSLTGVEGPGAVTVYLQSGTFGEPQVLWDSRSDEGQPVWVDVNTHTHANWVFSKPGIYLMQLRASADLIDGSTVTDIQEIRFAVGSDADPADALATEWQGGEPASSPEEGEANAPGNVPDTNETDPLVPILIGSIIIVSLGLILAFAVVVMRGNRVRKRILDARASRDDNSGEPE